MAGMIRVWVFTRGVRTAVRMQARDKGRNQGEGCGSVHQRFIGRHCRDNLKTDDHARRGYDIEGALPGQSAFRTEDLCGSGQTVKLHPDLAGRYTPVHNEELPRLDLRKWRHASNAKAPCRALR